MVAQLFLLKNSNLRRAVLKRANFSQSQLLRFPATPYRLRFGGQLIAAEA
jgi:uncharacterized protein YjbI with pentapeptide repeats